MSKTVLKSFVGRITSPTHAGHGGRQSPDLLQSTCIRSTDSTPRLGQRPQKGSPRARARACARALKVMTGPCQGHVKQPASQAEMLLAKTQDLVTTVRARANPSTAALHISTLLQSVLGDLKQELKHVVKREMQTLADSLLAPIASRISDLEDHAQHQREDISRISAENKKLRKTHQPHQQMEQIAAKTDATVINIR